MISNWDKFKEAGKYCNVPISESRKLEEKMGFPIFERDFPNNHNNKQKVKEIKEGGMWEEKHFKILKIKGV